MRLNNEELEVCTVRDLIIARAANGDKPLAHIREETLSYQEAHIRSNRFANALQGLGVGKGDVVATCLYNSIDHICIWFACAKLGAIWAPLNVSLVHQDLIYGINDTGARIVIVDGELLENFLRVQPELPQIRCAVLLGDDATAKQNGMVPFSVLRDGIDHLPDTPVSPSDPMGIIYTGGSTGMPKGVLVPNLYYIANAMRYRDAAQATPDDIHQTIGHLFHSGGQLIGVMGPMFCHMTTVLSKWFSASRYWSLAKKYRVTIIDPIGPMIAAILRQPEREDDRAHSVRVGVGVATAQIAREIRDRFEVRFGVPLLEVYAQAESGVILTTETLTSRRRGSSGKPRGWAEFCIVDENDQELPRGQVGQILLRPLEPYSFMLEYFGKPEQTLKAWRNLWFHTGDLGRMDEEGYLYFVGRMAHWIRHKGENVTAFEVEQVITSHPAVADCAVVGVPSEMGEEDIKACVQLKEGIDRLEPLEIVRHCEERIAFFKVPRYVEFVDSFPRSAAKNEIERHKLRERGIGNAWDREKEGYSLKHKR
jgi:carnitine-CoA ligase